MSIDQAFNNWREDQYRQYQEGLENETESFEFSLDQLPGMTEWENQGDFDSCEEYECWPTSPDYILKEGEYFESYGNKYFSIRAVFYPETGDCEIHFWSNYFNKELEYLEIKAGEEAKVAPWVAERFDTIGNFIKYQDKVSKYLIK